MTSKKNRKPINNNSDNYAILKRIQAGNEEAKEDIIKKNAPLVVSIAKKYHNCFRYIDISELIAEGNRGLWEALKNYDHRQSTKFSTYAWFWIVKNIQEYINSSVALIGIPNKALSDLRKIVSTMQEDVGKGKISSLKEISKKLALDLDRVRELLAKRKNMTKLLSLDKSLNKDEQEGTLGDIVSDEGIDAIPEMLDQFESKTNITKMLEKLSPVEAEIIQWRYGFKDSKFHTLKEISERMHLSANKIKDIESIALGKLKKLSLETAE